MPVLTAELVQAWDGEACGLSGLSGSGGTSDPGDLVLGLTWLLLQCVTPGKLLPLSRPGFSPSLQWDYYSLLKPLLGLPGEQSVFNLERIYLPGVI